MWEQMEIEVERIILVLSKCWGGLSCNITIFIFGLNLFSCNLPQKRNENKTADINGEYLNVAR